MFFKSNNHQFVVFKSSSASSQASSAAASNSTSIILLIWITFGFFCILTLIAIFLCCIQRFQKTKPKKKKKQLHSMGSSLTKSMIAGGKGEALKKKKKGGNTTSILTPAHKRKDGSKNESIIHNSKPSSSGLRSSGNFFSNLASFIIGSGSSPTQAELDSDGQPESESPTKSRRRVHKKCSKARAQEKTSQLVKPDSSPTSGRLTSTFSTTVNMDQGGIIEVYDGSLDNIKGNTEALVSLVSSPMIKQSKTTSKDRVSRLSAPKIAKVSTVRGSPGLGSTNSSSVSVFSTSSDSIHKTQLIKTVVAPKTKLLKEKHNRKMMLAKATPKVKGQCRSKSAKKK